MSPHLPPTGYAARDATTDDAPEIASLINETNIAEIGIPWTSTEEVRDDLTSPGRQVGDDVVLVSEEGALVGYLTLWADTEPFTEVHQLVFVRPALWGRGLSSWLLRLGEERARAKIDREPDGTIFLRASRWAGNDAARTLFGALGYRHARTFDIMRRELDGPIAEPRIPEGIAIRTFDRERDASAVHEALAEAFADHWGGLTFPPFDGWLHEAIEGESSGFDPGLWFIAFDDGRIVGAVCARHGTARAPETGEVGTLGVRRRWRGRGLGQALLLAVFGELAKRGVSTVELGVDRESETGATRLYDRVGMRVVYTHEAWEKELLPARAGA